MCPFFFFFFYILAKTAQSVLKSKMYPLQYVCVCVCVHAHMHVYLWGIS